ncbi:MAG: aldo/keto reductase [Pseudomonadota bacterium]|jgi:aryl-alcohol dehydrogenase-like predicted oxidoreductase
MLTKYKTLGRSGLRVSPLCLGTMTFGQQWGWGSSAEESKDILDRYLELGGNFIDTANIYTKGYSEHFIGEYFANKTGSASNHPRDRVVIATKFMGNMYIGDPNGGGAGRKAIIGACEESLRRLRTDYIDLYWAHFWDQFTPLDEMVRAMDDLVRTGKVRYIGLSDHPAWVVAHCHHLLKEINGAPLIALQIEYSLAQRTVEGELMPMAQHFGLGVTPWSPLRAGLLSGKINRKTWPTEATRMQKNSPHLTEKNYQIIDELAAVSEEVAASPAQVAIRWLMQKAGVTSPIIGARTLAQLEDNVQAATISLTEQQMARLDSVSSVTHAFPYDFVQAVKANILGGTEVNGETRPAWDLAPASDAERF